MTLKFPKSSTTKPLFNDFFPARVITLVTEREMDFTLNLTDGPFTQTQKGWLESLVEFAPEKAANIKQVHGNRIVVADERYAGVVEADGLVTDRIGRPLVVRTADCLPVFLFDEKTPAVGLVHAGWRGTKDLITLEAVEVMADRYQTKTQHLKVAFGPCIRPKQYEVGPEFREHFPREVTRKNGKYYFDLALANKNQLTDHGVPAENIYDCGICTFENSRYHSFRRDAQAAGRILSLIMLKE